MIQALGGDPTDPSLAYWLIRMAALKSVDDALEREAKDNPSQ